MRNELVHRLTHVGHRLPSEALPDRGTRRRVGELARSALHVSAALALLAAATLAVQLAAIAVGTGLAAHPVVVWAGVLVATAAAPTLAVRLVGRVRRARS